MQSWQVGLSHVIDFSLPRIVFPQVCVMAPCVICRTLWAPAFNNASLSLYFGLMLSKADALVTVIGRLVDQDCGFDIWDLMVGYPKGGCRCPGQRQ